MSSPRRQPVAFSSASLGVPTLTVVRARPLLGMRAPGAGEADTIPDDQLRAWKQKIRKAGTLLGPGEEDEPPPGSVSRKSLIAAALAADGRSLGERSRVNLSLRANVAAEAKGLGALTRARRKEMPLGSLMMQVCGWGAELAAWPRSSVSGCSVPSDAAQELRKLQDSMTATQLPAVASAAAGGSSAGPLYNADQKRQSEITGDSEEEDGDGPAPPTAAVAPLPSQVKRRKHVVPPLSKDMKGKAAAAPVRPLLVLESSLVSSLKVKSMLNDAREHDTSLDFLERELQPKAHLRTRRLV